MKPRGTTTARGYGSDHKRQRAAVAADVARGRATCSICHQPIQPGSPWHLDHTHDRTGYRGPAHKRCNEQDGGRKGARIAAALRRAARRPPAPTDVTTLRW